MRPEVMAGAAGFGRDEPQPFVTGTGDRARSRPLRIPVRKTGLHEAAGRLARLLALLSGGAGPEIKSREKK